ncbi:ABC transporter substrate-binding protein [Geothrix sp. 21YS21S-4]|uniref:ABC transporter substrate-binding protein n=1 Tax=Geothrix sp. 21YS21S-4 TaxID=3068889 RepID=UPI0027B9A80C|nr:ABC transporter substrate-binding protein [Geothrix sp. 21YS21S-4]
MRNRLAALLFALLAAFSPPSLRAQMVEESLPQDPGPLDFIRGDSYEQWILQSLAGDALVGLAADGRTVPRLAASWKLRKDGALLFTLRTDARFPDGSPVAPEDVVWTLRELLRPGASPTKRAILEGAETGVEDGRVWLRSPRPPARLLLELARIPIAQRNHPDRGSGPFLYRKEAAAWVFTRREHFLKPQIEGIRFRLLPDANAVLQALQKSWLAIGAPPPRHQGDPPPTHRLLVQPMHAQLVAWSRTGAGALLLLERWRKDAFPPRLLGRNAKASRGLWPETLGFEPRAIDPGENRLQPPPPGTPLKLHYAAGEESVEKLLLALRERARRDGYDLQLIPMEQGLLVDRLQKGNFDLACSVVVFDPHPWAVFEYLESGGPMNFTGWHHPRFRELATKAQQPGDAGWRGLQALWAANPAALPLLDFHSAIWVDRRLMVEPGPQGLYLSTPGAAGWRWAR